MSVAAQDSWTEIVECAPPAFRARVKELAGAQQVPFLEFALSIFEQDAALKKRGTSSGLLLDSGTVPHAVLDLDSAPLPEAIRLAKAAAVLDDRFDVKLLNAITSASHNWPGDVSLPAVARALEVIDAISDCRRLSIPLLKFAKIADPKIRSKAIKLMARACQNGGWVESIFSDPDPRVRCNMIEGIYANLGREAERILRRASKDPHHRVATTALLCLAQMGDNASRDALENMTGDGREMHARAATWALSKLKETTPSNTTPHPTA